MEGLSRNLHNNATSVIQITDEITNILECGDDFIMSLFHTKLQLKRNASKYNISPVFKMFV